MAVNAGHPAAAALLRKHATPQRVPDIARASGPVAGPEWRIEQLGYAPSEFDLLTESHVIAVPPGENGWIHRLEQFLFAHQSAVKRLLQQEAAKQ